MLEVRVRDGLSALAPRKHGARVDQVGNLRATEALRLEGQRVQVDVVVAGPLGEVHLQIVKYIQCY